MAQAGGWLVTILLDAPTEVADFRRDQWGRPYIMQPNGKRVGYTRCSSAAKTIEDTFNLEKWAKRNVAYGMAHDSSLVARILALGGDPSTWDKTDKGHVDDIVEAANAVAKAHKAADIGTAVHRLTERMDRGEDVIGGPYQADLDAYRAAMNAAGLNPAHVECRMVNDDLKMAGTCDRIVAGEGSVTWIADIKTSASVDFGGLGWAAQLAAYAGGSLYDVEAEERIATPTIDREVGYIIHLPAGQGRCDIYEVDLVGGLAACRLANEIRSVRTASKKWITLAAPVAALAVEQPAGVAAEDTATPAISPGDRVTFDFVDKKVVVEPSRKDQLVARFEKLTPDQKADFKSRRMRKGDLDAVERALDSITNTSSRPTEGPDVDEATWAPVVAAANNLPAAAKTWCGRLFTESRDAGVTFHRASAPTLRRYELYRGLVALAKWFPSGNDDADDVLRALVYAASGGDDATQFANVTPGHALGSLNADEAATFAQLVDRLVAGDIGLTVRPDGVMVVAA